jgi:hypothetical protein
VRFLASFLATSNMNTDFLRFMAQRPPNAAGSKTEHVRVPALSQADPVEGVVGSTRQRLGQHGI